MKRLRIVLIALLVSGCASLQSFWDDEFLSKYRPDVLVDRQKNILAEGLNYQLGRSKSERIRVAGPPQECVTLETAGERCEWKSAWVATKSVSPDTQSRTTEAYQYFTFIYDRNGIASSWSYRGPYGQFTNADYKQTKTQRPSSSQPAPSLEREWVHPTKARKIFSQDYFQCQEDMKRDPRGQQGARFLMQDAIESCVKEKGWVPSVKQ